MWRCLVVGVQTIQNVLLGMGVGVVVLLLGTEMLVFVVLLLIFEYIFLFFEVLFIYLM